MSRFEPGRRHAFDTGAGVTSFDGEAPGSYPGEGGSTPPWPTQSTRASAHTVGDRLMAGQQALTLSIEVRVLIPEPTRRRPGPTRRRPGPTRRRPGAISDNRIVDDARGRAPPRPQRRPRSRSGDGAWLKSRRCWFDSRRGHFEAPVARRSCSRSIGGRARFDSERAHGGRGIEPRSTGFGDRRDPRSPPTTWGDRPVTIRNVRVHSATCRATTPRPP